MSNIKHGGPAFPGPYVNETGGIECVAKQGGMSLRDYFAAKAMQSLMMMPGELSKCMKLANTPEGESVKSITLIAYYMADAMLKAREKSDE